MNFFEMSHEPLPLGSLFSSTKSGKINLNSTKERSETYG